MCFGFFSPSRAFFKYTVSFACSQILAGAGGVLPPLYTSTHAGTSCSERERKHSVYWSGSGFPGVIVVTKPSQPARG